VRSHFSPNPGTGPSAALRGRGRIGSDSGLAAGCVAGTSSRGRRRRARCGPVVRFFPRALLHEVAKDGADGADGGVGQIGGEAAVVDGQLHGGCLVLQVLASAVVFFF